MYISHFYLDCEDIRRSVRCKLNASKNIIFTNCLLYYEVFGNLRFLSEEGFNQSRYLLGLTDKTRTHIDIIASILKFASFR